uniref:Uncharacterized protein n=1 Tax=Anguilla anguilla TaxID=7936 RepID=A0A0E9PSP1_ANGAN
MSYSGVGGCIMSYSDVDGVLWRVQGRCAIPYWVTAV